MNRRRLLSTTALLSLIALPLGAQQLGPPSPFNWSVTCLTAKIWSNTTAPNMTNGAFQFTLQDGTEIRTTAGMNCYATRAPAPRS